MASLSLRNILLRIFSAVMVIMATTLATSCNSESTDPTYLVQEWATYTGTLGGKPTFDVQRTGNGPVYTLVGDRTLGNSTVPVGARVIISYELPSLDVLPTSGEIALTGCSGILTYTPQVVDMDTVADWNVHALYIESVTRTGGYINVMSQAYVNTSDLASTFTFYVDKASLDTSSPLLYLRYNRPMGSINAGRVPMSLDVRTFWNQPERFDGVTLNIRNGNVESLSVFDFPRSAENFVQPNN